MASWVYAVEEDVMGILPRKKGKDRPMLSQYLSGNQPLWSVWYVGEKLGSGAYGQVFRLYRKDSPFESALKWIPIPPIQEDVERLRLSNNFTLDGARRYYNGVADRVGKEIELMNKLKGDSHIVDYADHLKQDRINQVGCDILIRMELLTPLNKKIQQEGLKERDVGIIGLHICLALSRCEKESIIHRDIKPENILYAVGSDNYKLGDFGVARELEKTLTEVSRKGTPSYMAPELYRGQNCDNTSDIYSLGLVMYRLLNNNRAPFTAHTGNIDIDQYERANARRIKGDPLPPPAYGSPALHQIVLKACAFNPQERYIGAQDMAQALEQLIPSLSSDKMILSPNPDQPPAISPDLPLQEKRNVKIPKMLIASLTLLVAIIIIVLGIGRTPGLSIAPSPTMAVMPEERTASPYTAPVTPEGTAAIPTPTRAPIATAAASLPPATSRAIVAAPDFTNAPSQRAIPQTQTPTIMPTLVPTPIRSSPSSPTASPIAVQSKESIYNHALTLLAGDETDIVESRVLFDDLGSYKLSTDLSLYSQGLMATRKGDMELAQAYLRPLVARLPLLLVLSEVGLPAPAELLQTSAPPSPAPTTEAEDEVHWMDPVLKQKVSDALGLPASTSITRGMLARLRVLPINIGKGREGSNVHKLDNLSDCVNLEELHLPNNFITLVDPLAEVPSLRVLNLSGNSILDISPLASLINLTELDLSGTRISDLSALDNLSKLRTLNVKNTPILPDAEVRRFRDEHPECSVIG